MATPGWADSSPRGPPVFGMVVGGRSGTILGARTVALIIPLATQECSSRGEWLRPTAITNVYRATKDLYLTQRFARHSSPLTTTVYTHPTDEELYTALRGVRA